MAETNPTALIKTNFGDIQVELNAEKAPKSVQNFIDYAKSGHYDGTVFHRIIDGFMVQGGGFDQEMNQKSVNAPIKNEATNKLKNDRGTLAMARTQVVDSATSQFFINLVDNDFLNHTAKTPAGYGYAVFAEVTEGMDTVDKMSKVATGTFSGHQDVPTSPVIIESVTISE